MKKVEVAIIGAGTSGLVARRQVAGKTDNYVIIDDGPLGTTCARVGCMPSKVLIQAANDFGRRSKFEQMGIRGGENLTIDTVAVMDHVRSLRDRFVRGVMGGLKEWEKHLVRGRAEFVDSHTLQVNGEKIHAEKIILAVGSRPLIPQPWLEFKDSLVTTDDFFEMKNLPSKMAVIGLGVIGIELGQALNNLGVEVIGITKGQAIGGLTDPEIQKYVSSKFSEEFKIYFDGGNITGLNDKGQLIVEADGEQIFVDKALVSVGRRSNVDRLGLDKLGINLDSTGFPEININTMKLKEAPHIFLPGDGNGDRPILHEAADEGVMAGYNAVNEELCFKRRVSLGITFSEPNIATVGERFQQLKDRGADFVTGEVSFEGQGRSIVKLKEQGILHVYAQKDTGLILGAELQAPDGEHLAHLLSWAISLKMTLQEALGMPFYHPVVEEGLRTALRDAHKKANSDSEFELFRCQDPPIR